MKKIKLYICVIGLILCNLAIAKIAHATSGACSSHGGVNCSAGWDYNGNVICNDGWVNSSVMYSNTEECKSTTWCSNAENYQIEQKYKITDVKNIIITLDNSYLQKELSIKNETVPMDVIYGRLNTASVLYNEQRNSLINILTAIQSVINSECSVNACTESEKIQLESKNLIPSQEETLKTNIQSLLNLSDLGTIAGLETLGLAAKELKTQLINIEYQIATSGIKVQSNYNLINIACYNLELERISNQLQSTQYTCTNYGVHSYLGTDNSCYCQAGYKWNTEKTSCVETLSTINCTLPTVWSAEKQGCIMTTADSTTNTVKTSDIFEISTPIENSPNAKKAPKNLLGYILLQVQSHGEAWYVDPITSERYYMKNGSIAYQMMRSFGLGITESDYFKITAQNSTLKNQLKGRIVLRVEAHGEAYYIHPKDLSVHYLQNGDEAYRVMRLYSLGITNTDLEKILENTITQK